MENKNFESRIYFTEKDIYDALMSSKKTMTTSIIMELARDRGLLLSREDSREDLIKYLSKFIYDYYDLNVLLDHLTPAHKKEKSKATKIETKIDSSHLLKATNDISNSNDENINIQVTTDSYNIKKKTLKIAYDEIDLSKTRLRQKVRRESIIEIVEEDDTTKIRKPANKKVDEILEKILAKISTSTSTELEEKKINLYGLSFQQKTNFFTSIINKIEGCQLDDVTKITVNKDNIENDEDIENNEEDIEEEFINIVTNASFKGNGLLQTPEYQKLKDSGYSLTSISWQSKEVGKNGNKLEFEASISSARENQELSFSVKGIYRYDENKKTHTRTLRPLKKEETDKYTEILEKGAFSIYNEIISETLEVDDEAAS